MRGRTVNVDLVAALCPVLEKLSVQQAAVDVSSAWAGAAMTLPCLHTFLVSSHQLPRPVLFNAVSQSTPLLPECGTLIRYLL